MPIEIGQIAYLRVRVVGFERPSFGDHPQAMCQPVTKGGFPLHVAGWAGAYIPLPMELLVESKIAAEENGLYVKVQENTDAA